MKKKELEKIADIFVKNENIMRDKNASKEEKYAAEKEMMRYSQMIMSMKNGMTVLDELDDLILKKLKK